MSRIARITQKIFASAASNNGVFGSAQAGTKVLSNDVSVLQGLAAYGTGWLSAVIGSSKFPALEEFQALDYINTSQLAYLFQEGIPAYDVGTTYYTNSIVKKAGTYQLYGSVTNNNLGNALTDPTNWALLVDLSTAGAPNFNVQIKTSSGTYTKTAGTIGAFVLGVGGGAGSGGATATGASSGGGGGGFAVSFLSSATLGATQSVTIGAAGTAGAAGANNGGDGGQTLFGAFLTCNGGTHGVWDTPGATNVAGGGVGGAASGGNILNRNGGPGQHGLTITAAKYAGGHGGSTPLGTGGYGAATVISGDLPGNVGTGFGAGGGGATCGTTDQPGAAGTAGAVIILELT